MKSQKNDTVICRLKAVRTQKGLTQTQLAGRVGLKRQAIYDIEKGRYLPNTAVALKLARHLGCRVEDIFAEAPSAEDRPVSLVDDGVFREGGSRLTVAKVRGDLVGYPLGSGISLNQGVSAADGLLTGCKERVQLLCNEEYLEKSALLLGCDPAFSLLSSHVLRTPGKAQVHWRFASSYRALERLAAGQAHIAGIHLHNAGSPAESNAALAKRMLSGAEGRLIAFAAFEEGLMVASGNPHGIREVADLAREDVRIVNREPGAALRVLLDDFLKRAGVPAAAVSGYDHLVGSHLEGAQQVMFGMADAALGLRAVADSCGLGFVPIESVRCDLVIPADIFDHPAVSVVLNVLQSRSFRDELAMLPGYETTCTGKVVAEV
ncbi:XRE family transcriptional regulator [Desulfonema ishimotonii]|uniref:XRE family transcriptional regulator n=1 Tax=Desulfonema ishimotonii TaxID=45657 RepID=A0A401FRA3_9BACT|nr:substrate-binding domain-containing protein [Desulfonema ishimotonii]GBC59490.1 XRE family transcriptional regulator [Desulfonema ishimotonii]